MCGAGTLSTGATRSHLLRLMGGQLEWAFAHHPPVPQLWVAYEDTTGVDV